MTKLRTIVEFLRFWRARRRRAHVAAKRGEVE